MLAAFFLILALATFVVIIAYIFNAVWVLDFLAILLEALFSILEED